MPSTVAVSPGINRAPGPATRLRSPCRLARFCVRDSLTFAVRTSLTPQGLWFPFVHPVLAQWLTATPLIVSNPERFKNREISPVLPPDTLQNTSTDESREIFEVSVLLTSLLCSRFSLSLSFLICRDVCSRLCSYGTTQRNVLAVNTVRAPSPTPTNQMQNRSESLCLGFQLGAETVSLNRIYPD